MGNEAAQEQVRISLHLGPGQPQHQAPPLLGRPPPQPARQRRRHEPRAPPCGVADAASTTHMHVLPARARGRGGSSRIGKQQQQQQQQQQAMQQRAFGQMMDKLRSSWARRLVAPLRAQLRQQ